MHHMCTTSDAEVVQAALKLLHKRKMLKKNEYYLRDPSVHHNGAPILKSSVFDCIAFFEVNALYFKANKFSNPRCDRCAPYS